MEKEGMRKKLAQEDTELALLTEIRDLLKGTAPPPPPVGGFPTLDELKTMIETALEEHGVLKRATDWYVSTIDLAIARTAPTELTDLADALSLTIYRNTGSFTLWLQKPNDTKKITVDALTYPQTLLIDWLDIKKVYIQNTAQTGLTAQILKFFRA